MCKRGVHMRGRKLPRSVVDKISAHKRGKSYEEIYGSERADVERQKRREGNLGPHPKRDALKPVYRARVLALAAGRRGKTYEEIFGTRAAAIRQKQKATCAAKWVGHVYAGSDQRSYHIQNSKYSVWRFAVFSRDDFTCQICGRRGTTLEAHHVKSWARFADLRYSLENGLTVCKKLCHGVAERFSRTNVEASLAVCIEQLALQFPAESTPLTTPAMSRR